MSGRGRGSSAPGGGGSGGFAALRLRLRGDRQRLEGRAGAEGAPPGRRCSRPGGSPGRSGNCGRLAAEVPAGCRGGGAALPPRRPRVRAGRPVGPGGGLGLPSGHRAGHRADHRADEGSRRARVRRRSFPIARIAGSSRPRRPGGGVPQRPTTADLRLSTRVRCALSPAGSGKADGRTGGGTRAGGSRNSPDPDRNPGPNPDDRGRPARVESNPLSLNRRPEILVRLPGTARSAVSRRAALPGTIRRPRIAPADGSHPHPRWFPTGPGSAAA